MAGVVLRATDLRGTKRSSRSAAVDAAPRPFVKWAGGKRHLAPRLAEIAATLPFRRYSEPFLGGGAVFFWLAHRGLLHDRPVVLADANPELMVTYAVVRDRVEELIADLRQRERSFKAGDRRAYYYRVRQEQPADPVQRASRLLFLNKTCYNGLYRVNREGRFNVPYGDYANPRIVDPAILRAASAALQGVGLRTGDYRERLAGVEPGDLVYLDPPYHPLSATASFTGYTGDGFGPAEQRQLAAEFHRLAELGASVVLSNSDHPLIRELYTGYPRKVVRAPRAINCNGAGRGLVAELLITSF